MKVMKDMTSPKKASKGKVSPVDAKPGGGGKSNALPRASNGAKPLPIHVSGINGFGGSSTIVPQFLRRDNICLSLEYELAYDFAANTPGNQRRPHKLISQTAYRRMQPAFHLADFLFRWSKPFFLRLLDAPLEHLYTLCGTRVYNFSESWELSEHAEANYATAVTFFNDHVRLFALEPDLRDKAWACASADFRYGDFRLVLELHPHILSFYASKEYNSFTQQAKVITHLRVAVFIVHEMVHLFYKIRRTLLLAQDEERHDPADLSLSFLLDVQDEVIDRVSEWEPKLGLWDTTKTDRGELGRAWEHLVLGGGPKVGELFGCDSQFQLSKTLEIYCQADEDYSFKVSPAEIKALVDPEVLAKMLALTWAEVVRRSGKATPEQLARYEKVSILWRVLDAVKGGIPVRHKYLEAWPLSDLLEDIGAAREVEARISGWTG